MSNSVRSPLVPAIAVLVALVSGSPPAAQAQSSIFAYPKAGQSREQQQRDHRDCHIWAVEQTGVDPTRAPAPSHAAVPGAPPPSQSGVFGRGRVGQGGAVGDAARGAALGAIGGAIAGDAGAGAGYGAAAGALFGAVRRRGRQVEQAQWEAQQAQKQAQQQQQAAAARQQSLAVYDRAYGACMTARDYEVQ